MGKIIRRSGWEREITPAGTLYVHVSGWVVQDANGPNEGTAFAASGPQAGQSLLADDGRPFFSVFQAMLCVERHLRQS